MKYTPRRYHRSDTAQDTAHSVSVGRRIHRDMIGRSVPSEAGALVDNWYSRMMTDHYMTGSSRHTASNDPLQRTLYGVKNSPLIRQILYGTRNNNHNNTRTNFSDTVKLSAFKDPLFGARFSTISQVIANFLLIFLQKQSV